MASSVPPLDNSVKGRAQCPAIGAITRSMPITPRPIVLLVQPRDDGLEMYAEFLRYHGLDVVGVSDAWDALNAAPAADVIVTGLLLPSSLDGVELITRLRIDR